MYKTILMFGTTTALLVAANQSWAQKSTMDQTFATKAAAGGQAEVSLGQLATTNAKSPQVRQFGQQMVTDHTQANQELQAIGKQESLTLPAKPDAADSAAEQRLQASKGAAFDTAYTRDMIKDHQQDIAEFQKEATTGKDPALKAFAQKYLPVLKHHLEMAHAMQTKS
jgi:putative membrane protein